MALSNVVIDIYHGDTITNSGFHDIQSAGIVGVIHKATQGDSVVDTEYDTRKARALSVGLLWGSYHFGTGDDPADQAKFYLDTAQPAAGHLVCLDFEDYSHDQMTLAKAEAFVTAVHNELNRYPVLYTGQAFIKSQLGNKTANQTVLSNCSLWVARYSVNQPTIPPAFSKFTMWQYTDGTVGPQPHSVPGVANPLDRDKYNGTIEELKAWWGT